MFAEAVALHPNEPLAHVNLANLMMYADELEAARAHYEIALTLDPANAAAHQRLSALLRDLGEPEAAERHRRLGFGATPDPALSLPRRRRADPAAGPDLDPRRRHRLAEAG